MPFCPSCATEYVSGIERCSDCGVGLVDELSTEPEPGDVQWVHLCSVSNEVEGALLQERLEQQGIRTLLKKDVFASGFGRQGTNLYVAQQQLQQARQISAELGGA